MDVTWKIGQRMIAGFPGYEIPDSFREAVHKWHIGNFILFGENITDKTQLKNLCSQLQQLAVQANGVPAFITIDQEGGVVSRLKEDAAVVPGAMCLSSGGDPEATYRAGLITGRQLAAAGCNFDLAPVMDVNSNPQNPVIGVRSYGESPETVAEYGTQMIRGLCDGGVLSCAKHFPGHGDTAVDSHLGLPVVDKSLQELEACELIPFRAAIAAGVPSIMTTHILFPQLEPDGVPATMSRRIITGLLREKMGYEGLIVSDSMEMQAIARFYGTVPGMIAAMAAGVDLVMPSHTVSLVGEAQAAAVQALAQGKLSMEEMDASVERILMAKKKLVAGGDESVIGCGDHRMQVEQMMENGISMVHGPVPELGASPVFLGCPSFQTTLASNPVNKPYLFAGILSGMLGGDAINTAVDPSAEEIHAAVAAVQGHSCAVIGTYNGHIKTGQLELVRAIARSCPEMPVVCVALRDPYDLFMLPRRVCGIAAFEYDMLSMKAVAKVLRRQLCPRGNLPVAMGEVEK